MNFDDELKDSINTLEQNMFSEFAMERFLDSIYEGDTSRTISIPNTLKEIDDSELQADNLTYFIEMKEEMEVDFFERLEDGIGTNKATYFCSLIKEFWFDGRSKRTKSVEIQQLKYWIHEYLSSIPCQKKIYVLNEKPTLSSDRLSKADIQSILNINEEMFDHYIQNWIGQHPRYDDMNTNYVYFRRGLNDAELKQPYYENDYINSYTISTTIAEQFATAGSGKKLIISGEYSIFRKRILFFSPFIKGMSPKQLEIGIIPHTMELTYSEQGEFGGIPEFKIVD